MIQTVRHNSPVKFPKNASTGIFARLGVAEGGIQVLMQVFHVSLPVNKRVCGTVSGIEATRLVRNHNLLPQCHGFKNEGRQSLAEAGHNKGVARSNGIEHIAVRQLR
jgi:hypothetical protein